MATSQELRAQFDLLPVQEQQKFIGSLPQPQAEGINRVWYLVIVGLLILALGAGYLAYLLYANGTGEAGAGFLSITTAVVGGLIGLLAPSPVSKP